MFSSLRRLIPHRTRVSGAGQGAGDPLLVAFDGSTQRARVAIGTCVGLHRPEGLLRRSIMRRDDTAAPDSRSLDHETSFIDGGGERRSFPRAASRNRRRRADSAGRRHNLRPQADAACERIGTGNDRHVVDRTRGNGVSVRSECLLWRDRGRAIRMGNPAKYALFGRPSMQDLLRSVSRAIRRGGAL